MDIRKISTQRLLNIYRNMREEILYVWPSSRSYSEAELDQLEQSHQFMDSIKAELATREHVPRKHERRKAKAR